MIQIRCRALLLPLLPLLLGVAACGGGSPAAAGTPPPPVLATDGPAAATPAAAPSDGGGPAALVRAKVTGVSPRLLPAAVPPDMTAAVRSAEAGGFMVEYSDSRHIRTVVVGTESPAAVSGPHPSMRQMPFRGQQASYQVFDTTVPTSQRALTWMEPGKQVTGGRTVGHVAYSLSATGFTEAEFLQLAGSLQPV